jgi:REP element-mobilizing transposase RayT
MAHTHTALLFHLIFSTKHRAPPLTPEIRPRLFPYMGGIIRDLRGTALLINGPADHVHLLTSVPPVVALSDLLRELKAISSAWVNDVFHPHEEFAWQTGYGAFTVSKSAEESVHHYILNQEEHHKRTTFEEEYFAFLKRHAITYDPRFLFD